MQKSTVDEIRQRFDRDVERFSNLETGQTASVDASLALSLVAVAAASVTPGATRLLDIGCGAGNFSLRCLESLPLRAVTLLDLSAPMLRRAQERVGLTAEGCSIVTVQSDVRDAQFEEGAFDVIIAGAVFHHLRSDSEWRSVFSRCLHWLTAGGSLWIFDLVAQESPAIETVIQHRYGEYLRQLGGTELRDRVFAYIAKEDTPRSVPFQLGMLTSVGFCGVDVLHSNSGFAVLGGQKPGPCSA